jgi:hypothetical protein
MEVESGNELGLGVQSHFTRNFTQGRNKFGRYFRAPNSFGPGAAEPAGKFLDFSILPEQKSRGAGFLHFVSEQNFPTKLAPNIRLPPELFNYN